MCEPRWLRTGETGRVQVERADGQDDDAQPRLPRRGLLVLICVGAATLVGALVAEAVSSAQSAGGSPAPYGVVGCQAPAGTAPVDVAVSARALGADGAPTATLGGTSGGLQVGASVRDLSGYAARAVRPCEVVQVTVYLQDAADGAVAGSLRQAAAPLEVDGGDGRGRVVALDWRSWEASLPEGARGGDLQEQASWLVTLVDPQPGTYRLTGRVSSREAVGRPSSSGDVEVLLDVTPHGG